MFLQKQLQSLHDSLSFVDMELASICKFHHLSFKKVDLYFKWNSISSNV